MSNWNVSRLIWLRSRGVVTLYLKFLIYYWRTSVEWKWSHYAFTVGAAYWICKVLTWNRLVIYHLLITIDRYDSRAEMRGNRLKFFIKLTAEGGCELTNWHSGLGGLQFARNTRVIKFTTISTGIMHTKVTLVDHRCRLLVFEDLCRSLEDVFFALMWGMFEGYRWKHWL